MFTAEVFVGQTKGIDNKKAPTVLRLLLYIIGGKIIPIRLLLMALETCRSKHDSHLALRQGCGL